MAILNDDIEPMERLLRAQTLPLMIRTDQYLYSAPLVGSVAKFPLAALYGRVTIVEALMDDAGDG
jgi:hypothetical protein